DLEQSWTAGGVDYSLEIRFDLLLIAGGIALTLLSAAFVVPSISLTQVAKVVLDRPAVRQAEESLERAFAGVQSPRHTLTGDDPEGGPSDVLPRAFLLGNAPELAETVVMTATAGRVSDLAGQVGNVTYWRGATYSEYTGRGWQLAAGFEETIAAGQPINGQAGGMTHMGGHAGGMTYAIAVGSQGQAGGMTYHTIGLPVRFNQTVTTYWHAPGDLAWVSGVEAASWYTVTSTLATATSEQLRQSDSAAMPPDLLARYTALPDDLPGRLRELAQEIIGDEAVSAPLSAYDQARAIEAFLRQYPYSLDVELPPPGRDPVDYFLFELQRGYCDYYASAMIILARSLGLPARLVTGYLAAPPDDQGVQTIYEVNAHSWPELYFAGYGWFGFEPTAAFSSTQSLDSPERPPVFAGTTSPLPVPVQDRSWPTDILTHPVALTFYGLLAVGLAAWWWRRRQQARAAGLDGIQWAYGRLLRSAAGLGQSAPLSQTPAEFTAAFLSHLQQRGVDDRPPGLVRWLTGPIRRLTTLYETRQYGRAPITVKDEAAARQLWQTIRRPLWQLRLRYPLRRKIAPPP
ncbi:MAG: transglutaminase domain-containing protein, partial [Chloroflexota bacterium]